MNDKGLKGLAVVVAFFMGPALAVGLVEEFTETWVMLLTGFFGITALLMWMIRREIRA